MYFNLQRCNQMPFEPEHNFADMKCCNLCEIFYAIVPIGI